MDKILKCSVEYEKLLKKNYIFTLEDSTKIEFFFNKGHFHHLMGLNKLSDLTHIHTDKKSIFNKIRKSHITDKHLIKSNFYHKINDRLDNFYDIDLLLFNKVIVNFDPNSTNGSKLKSEYIFIKQQNNGYIHLCLALDNNKNIYYPETFIFDKTDYYLRNQTILNIVKHEII